jgi:hypothetical protein
MPQPDVASALAALIQQRQANKHDIAMAKLNSKLAIQQAKKEAKLGIGSNAKPTLTPNEKRGIRQDKSTALSMARQGIKAYMQAASKAGHPLPAPEAWSNQQWKHYADSLVVAFPSDITGNLANYAVGVLKRKRRPKNDPFAHIGHGASITANVNGG